jgi:hypothetical protein
MDARTWITNSEMNKRMTDEQINIAIAEECEWEDIAFNRGWIKAGDGKTQCVIPNYCKDLNAMHEAENAKEMPWNSDYSWWLGRVCTTQRGFDPDKQEEIEQIKIGQFATARQRAEAFLKTIGKWKEGK